MIDKYLATPAHLVVISFEPKMGPENEEPTFCCQFESLASFDILSFLRLHL